MSVEQIYTGCLAQGAYYIESQGEAVVIDPMREVDQYIKMAEERGAKIKYVFETHFHADFVSGHVDLAKKTGAQIVFGPTARTGYAFYEAEDQEEFAVGNMKIRVLHTPGHTPESSSFLLINAEGKAESVFTGDTLFLGDVGRPDLAIKSDVTEKDLAGMLYDSLHTKLMVLDDETVIYPGHGAGSSCGKNMSKETVGSIGHERKTNYALQPMEKDEFIKKVLHGILPPPQYFPKNAMMNKQGYDSIDEVLDRGKNALSAEEFTKKAAEGALILDTRDPQIFNKKHISGAINIGLGGKFAGWVGTLIEDLKTPILLLTDAGREEEAVMRMARVGYDNCAGYLQGGMETWTAAGYETAEQISISAEEFAAVAKHGNSQIWDVRNPNEFASEHVLGAQNFPLDFFAGGLPEADKTKTYYVHCAGGYRSMIASSILRKAGYENLVDVAGGFAAIKETEVGVSAYVCPSTL